MSQSQTIELAFNKPQFAAYQALGAGQTVCIPWGRGVGKSFWQRRAAYLLVAQWDGKRLPSAPHKGVRVVFLMDTLKHFRDIHAKLMQEELENDWSFLGGVVNKGTLEVRFPGGSWIQPFPAADHTSKAARGVRCDAVLVDECDDIDPHIYQSVVVPWFSEPWSYKLRVLGGTPRRGRFGLLYQMHALGKSDAPEHARYHTFHATYRDAPEHVDANTVADAKATTLPAVFRREWECSFDSAEGLVFDMYSDDFHVQAPPDGTRFTGVVVGVDWGYVDPGVFLVFGITGHGQDAQAYLIEEHYEPGQVLDYWTAKAQEIHQRYPAAKWFADPSQPASIETLRRSAHVNIMKADNRIEQGVSCVADKLMVRGMVDGETGKDNRWTRLYIHPSAVNMRRELVSYKRKADPRNPDQYTEAIVDRDNHAIDAARYGLMGVFGTPPATRVEWSTASFG